MFGALHVCALFCFSMCLPRQDCEDCPTAYVPLVVPGNIQAEDFDLGGEVLDFDLTSAAV